MPRSRPHPRHDPHPRLQEPHRRTPHRLPRGLVCVSLLQLGEQFLSTGAVRPRSLPPAAVGLPPVRSPSIGERPDSPARSGPLPRHRTRQPLPSTTEPDRLPLGSSAGRPGSIAQQGMGIVGSHCQLRDRPRLLQPTLVHQHFPDLRVGGRNHGRLVRPRCRRQERQGPVPFRHVQGHPSTRQTTRQPAPRALAPARRQQRAHDLLGLPCRRPVSPHGGLGEAHRHAVALPASNAQNLWIGSGRTYLPG